MLFRSFSDVESPVINVRRDSGVGSPADVLTANLTCSPSGATSTSISGSQGALNLNDKLDFVITGGTGNARRVTVVIKTTLN